MTSSSDVSPSTRSPEDVAQASPEQTHTRHNIYVGLVTVAAMIMSLPRLVPRLDVDDHGTFVSVAERLLAGDRLYVDVWDNKDPVFYWTLALGRLASPLADVAIEIGWVAAACVASYFLAMSRGLGRTPAMLVAGLVPVVLTGTSYVAGMTHIPGVALSLVAIALAARRRFLLAGAVLGLVVLTKITMTPVAAAGVLVCLWHHRRRFDILRLLGGTFGALLGGAIVLAIRGELSGWIETFLDNIVYSTGDLSSSRYGGAAGHLLRAFPESNPHTALFTLVALAAVLVTCAPSRRSGEGIRPTVGTEAAHGDGLMSSLVGFRLIWFSLAVDLLVLALTATWPYHGQALGVPAVLALVHVAAHVAGRQPVDRHQGRTARELRQIGLIALAAYCLGGALHPTFYVQSARGASDALASLTATPPTTSLLAGRPDIRTYARAGSNDETGHAVGLGDLRLTCPRFHQYSFQTADILDGVADCLARADALIVADNLVPDGNLPAWDAYVARVRALVSTGYDCVRTTGSEVCVRRPS